MARAFLNGAPPAGLFPEFVHGIFHGGSVFGMHQLQSRGANHLFLLIAHHPLNRRAGVPHLAIRVPDTHHVLAILHHPPEVLRRSIPVQLGLPRNRSFAQYTTHQRPIRLIHRTHAHFNQHFLAVFAPCYQLQLPSTRLCFYTFGVTSDLPFVLVPQKFRQPSFKIHSHHLTPPILPHFSLHSIH